MDTSRFDTITRRVASRRAALRTGGLGLAALFAPWRQVAAQESTPAATTLPEDADTESANPEFLFLQAFDGGSWLPKPGERDTYLLTLHGAAASTVFFSDRPDRIVGQAPTQQFLDALGFTPDNPPNAAIVAERAIRHDMQEVLIVELLNPVYDNDTGTLTYEARVLADYGEHGLAFLVDQQRDYELPEVFGAGSLFIDDCANGTSKCALKSDGTVIGKIGDIGCCWSWEQVECRVCDHDGESDYYGELCADKFPDACGYANGAYPCRSTDRQCHAGSPPPQ